MQTDYIPSEKDLQRFWSKVDKRGPDECWLRSGPRTRMGHTQIDWAGYPNLAHRVSWLLHRGPLGRYIQVKHQCGNPACVNPAHLYVQDAAQRFWSKVDTSGGPDACWEWLAHRNRGGYGGMRCNGDEEKAHRISWQIAFGPIPDGLCVLHKCDNCACVNSAHLFLGMRADNIADMVAKGRQNAPRGESHPFCKLSDERVAEIQCLYASGNTSLRLLAEQYGVDYTHISRLVHGRRSFH